MSRQATTGAQVRRWVRRELGWLLAAAGVATLICFALDVWVVSRHRWDLVAAAVGSIAVGLALLVNPGVRAAERPRRPRRRRRR